MCGFVRFLNERFRAVYRFIKSRNVIKEMVNLHRAIIKLYMHLGGLLSTQEARVALGYRLVRLLRFFRAYTITAEIIARSLANFLVNMQTDT